MVNNNLLIRVKKETKEELDKFKIHPREPYNAVISRALGMGETPSAIVEKTHQCQYDPIEIRKIVKEVMQEFKSY